MNWGIFFDIHKDLPRQGSGRDKYTQRAFDMIPKLSQPLILDVGCGPGLQTIKLAKLTDGRIIAIDIHQPYLDQLKQSAKMQNLSDRIEILNKSMFDMDFPKEYFDIIWAEGSIHVVGFHRGLLEWRRFLKPNGFLVVHDERESISEKLRHISSCGYELLDYFTLDEDTWWREYYAPLEKLINEIRTKPDNDAKVLAVLDEEQREIQLFKKDSSRYCSAFFVMKKR